MPSNMFKTFLLIALVSPSILHFDSSANPTDNKMTSKDSATPAAALGYVILYVPDVAATLAFYEQAFGLARRFFNDDNGKAYGELETGSTRLAFASLALIREHLQMEVISTGPDKPPVAVEIALTTPDVRAMFTRALKAGAKAVSEPAMKPWGQTVAYVRDNAGNLVEICTPMP
jgi:catechol 2,3-dioxygenase-like lactoylglutathione lyase family enzyme